MVANIYFIKLYVIPKNLCSIVLVICNTGGAGKQNLPLFKIPVIRLLQQCPAYVVAQKFFYIVF